MISKSQGLRIAALLLGASALSACATVTRGSTDAWVVNSEPSGAKVETTNGLYCNATPCAIKMSRKAEFTATLTKPGYKPATIQVSHKTANSGAAGVAGNVLLGGVIGLGVDMYTGASQDLTPNPVTVTLEKIDAPVVAARAPVAALADTSAASATPVGTN